MDSLAEFKIPTPEGTHPPRKPSTVIDDGLNGCLAVAVGGDTIQVRKYRYDDCIRDAHITTIEIHDPVAAFKLAARLVEAALERLPDAPSAP